MSARPPRILVAGVGNIFLQDDGFGPAVVKRLESRPLPESVNVFDFGTGGLNLAYEFMRGYDALVLVDATQQGEEPGTLYVIEPDEASVDGAISDGDTLDPHAMDPASVLRFVKAIAGWPGQVVVIGCEPGQTGDVGLGLTPALDGAVDRAVAVVEETVARLMRQETAADA